MSYDNNLDRLTVLDLRAIAADLKIAGRSKMKRAELVAVITRAEMDAKWDAATDEETARQDAPAPASDIDDHAAAVARMRANREAEEEAKAAARRARNRTNYAPAPEAATQADAATVEAGITPIDADVTVPAGMFDPELTYFADGTHVVMRAQGTEQHGVTVGMTTDAGPYQFQAVRFADGTVKNVAPHVLHRNDAVEQADAEAGELLDAVLGEHTESSVTVTIDRYTEGRASVKMQGHAFGDMTREAYRIGRKWELVDQEHGIVFFTIRAGSLQKAVKAWAKKLNTHAERIDVARSF